jgi:hypothetical protein
MRLWTARGKLSVAGVPQSLNMKQNGGRGCGLRQDPDPSNDSFRIPPGFSGANVFMEVFHESSDSSRFRFPAGGRG